MAGSNILCTDYWLGQNAVPKSGYSAGTDDSRMMNVSEIMQKYQVTISTNVIPSRCPIQTEVNVTPKATIWTTYSVPYSYNLKCVAYGNGIWIAFPYDSSGQYVYSYDGITWNSKGCGWGYVSDVTFGNGWFMISYQTTSLGAPKSARSSDGLNWWNPGYVITSNSGGLEHIEFLNGMFLGFMEVGNVNSRSYDGLSNWTTSSGGNSGCTDVAYYNGKYIKVGTSQVQFKTSTDGLGWTALQDQMYLKANYKGIAYGAGLWVAVAANSGSYYPAAVVISGNGTSWAKLSDYSTKQGNWTGIRYGNGAFVMIGLTGPSCPTIRNSLDGLNWNDISYSNGYNDVAYGNNVWIAVGNNVISRADG